MCDYENKRIPSDLNEITVLQYTFSVLNHALNLWNY